MLIGNETIHVNFLVYMFINLMAIASTHQEVPKFLTKFHQYNKSFRPNYTGSPLNVDIFMKINDISSISEVTMDYTIHFTLRHYWQDERLKFDRRKANVSSVVVGAEFAKMIWLPDTYFANSKKVSIQLTAATEKDMLLRLNHTGHILYSSRFMVTASCPMNLRYFPMDRQVCRLDLSSYAYSDREVIYNWINVTIPDNLALPDFEVLGGRMLRVAKPGSTGNFSHLVVEIYLARFMGFYLNQIYVPSSLIVIISWVTFWLEMDKGHQRVALTITTVLTITTLITNTNESLPKLSYVKAIDVYLFTCFLMVFASLVGGLNRRKEKLSDPEGGNLGPKSMKLRARRYAQRLDRASRILFPLMFLIFNLAYWPIYLNLSPHTADDLIYESRHHI